ncbi:helix-turn-helix transcriptional regulator [Dyella sp. 333MFSha]|uniref:helix-turn-helix domain-containing protein n=1 Tax=Dyella sp. 333MFSha TaxID=1798240 RepID=UPI0008842BBF|nr:helix-turn-helix transcriptional regulator [Dyella sp. 333MFSha]SDF26916.1 Helix-turn-helix domain-containing protein [Dyella sp. 333MFSha]
MRKPVPKLKSVHKTEQLVLCGLLRELRLATGFRQDQVAEKLQTSQTTVSDWELGARGVDLLVCRRLVAIYRVEWPAFIAELERRLSVLPTPAAELVGKQ